MGRKKTEYSELLHSSSVRSILRLLFFFLFDGCFSETPGPHLQGETQERIQDLPSLNLANASILRCTHTYTCILLASCLCGTTYTQPTRWNHYLFGQENKAFTEDGDGMEIGCTSGISPPSYYCSAAPDMSPGRRRRGDCCMQGLRIPRIQGAKLG